MNAVRRAVQAIYVRFKALDTAPNRPQLLDSQLMPVDEHNGWLDEGCCEDPAAPGSVPRNADLSEAAR